MSNYLKLMSNGNDTFFQKMGDTWECTHGGWGGELTLVGTKATICGIEYEGFEFLSDDQYKEQMYV
jgi:hypothetical protein